jgi:hypothetical protein
MAKNMRNVQDNHFQREEVIGIAAAEAAILLQWLVGQADPRIIYGKVGVVFESQMGIIYMSFFCMLLPWYRSYQYSRTLKRKSSVSAINHSDENNSDGTTPKSAGKEGDDNKFLFPKFNGYRKEIEAILESTSDFEEFEKFLAREFCSEELYFIHEVHLFKKDFEHMSEEKAIATAKKIWRKFILESSHLSVNISGVNRKSLSSLGHDEAVTKEALENLFDAAFLEVVQLLASDKFRRFKAQSKNYQLSRANKELGVEVQALPTETPTSPTGSASA